MHGNTHVIAANIADGLRSTHEITLVPVAEAPRGLVTGATLRPAAEKSASRSSRYGTLVSMSRGHSAVGSNYREGSRSDGAKR